MAKYDNITVELVGQDGNAFVIMGRVRAAMRRAGVPQAEQEAYATEAMSGDYDHLLTTTAKWVNVASTDDPDVYEDEWDEDWDDEDDW